jgi:hypothetical protein
MLTRKSDDETDNEYGVAMYSCKMEKLRKWLLQEKKCMLGIRLNINRSRTRRSGSQMM